MGPHITIFYSPHPWNGVGTFFFSNWYNRTVLFTVNKAYQLWKPAWTNHGFWQWDRLFGCMLINPSRDVVASLACYSYSKSVRLGGFKSVENDYLNGDVTPRIFEIFRIKIRAQASTFFSLRIFLYYIDIHIVHEKENCTPLRSYIPRAVNVGAELNVYENVS